MHTLQSAQCPPACSTSRHAAGRAVFSRFQVQRLGREQVCRAVVKDSAVYQGKFGPWSIEPEDVTEVLLYRVGITVATSAMVIGSLPALLPDGLGSAAGDLIVPNLNAITLLGSAGLGASLFLIHIYVDPLKKALQALWLTGLCGILYLMVSNDTPVPVYVVEHPWAVWLVGPLFASITGVAFKEGLCYGKPEAAALFLVTPILLLGHLTQWVPELGERGLLAATVAIMTVFAARKYTQPIKDDIGDKSIFMFLKKSPEEQAQILAQREAQGEDF